ncbi:MAG: pentapeptide repeat-containing protein [Acidimicrobiia bacterium]
MRRTWVLVAALALATAACGSSGQDLTNRFGDCTFEARTVCTNQNLQSVSLSYSDLTGADLSGSDLSGADMQSAILRNVKLVNANLSAADLTDADLRGADLTGATLYRATLDRADWIGAIRTGIRLCNTVFPDGSISDCPALDVPTGSVPPAAVVAFAAHADGQCIVDGVGEGIELDWAVRNAVSVGFSVDGARIASAKGTSGVKRLPVACDGKRHLFEIDAFGEKPPPATRTIGVLVRPGTPQPTV